MGGDSVTERKASTRYTRHKRLKFPPRTRPEGKSWVIANYQIKYLLSTSPFSFPDISPSPCIHSINLCKKVLRLYTNCRRPRVPLSPPPPPRQLQSRTRAALARPLPLSLSFTHPHLFLKSSHHNPPSHPLCPYGYL